MELEIPVEDLKTRLKEVLEENTKTNAEQWKLYVAKSGEYARYLERQKGYPGKKFKNPPT